MYRNASHMYTYTYTHMYTLPTLRLHQLIEGLPVQRGPRQHELAPDEGGDVGDALLLFVRMFVLGCGSRLSQNNRDN